MNERSIGERSGMAACVKFVYAAVAMFPEARVALHTVAGEIEGQRSRGVPDAADALLRLANEVEEQVRRRQSSDGATSGAFVKLRREDQGGSITYRLPSKSKTVRGPGPRVLLREGLRVNVRWPSGEETDEKLALKRKTVSVPSHGNGYDATQERYGVNSMHRGIRVWVDVAAVEVRFVDDVEVYA